MSPAITQLEGQKLEQIATANHTSEEVMLHLASRQRNRTFTDINRTRMLLLRKGKAIEEQDYLAFWKALEDAGIGTYFKGRGLNPDTFTWKYSLKLIAQSAITGFQAPVQPLKAKPKTEVKAKAAPKKKRRQRGITLATKIKDDFIRTEQFVQIKLRPTFTLEMRLPMDFNSAEAKKLCDSISNLAK